MPNSFWNKYLLFYFVGELLESACIVLKIFVVIGMIEFKVGDDSIVEIKVEKMSPVFAGFYDEIIFLHIFEGLMLEFVRSFVGKNVIKYFFYLWLFFVVEVVAIVVQVRNESSQNTQT